MRWINRDHNTENELTDEQAPTVFVPERGLFSDAASPDLRARIIADMRALAAFLEEHPELPISPHTSVEVTYFPCTSNDEVAFEEVAEAASKLRRIPAWEGEHYVVEHRHGAGRYRAVAIPEPVRSRYRAWLTYTGHVRQD